MTETMILNHFVQRSRGLLSLKYGLNMISRRKLLVALLFNISILFIGFFWIFHGNIWTDEGWYYGGAVLFSKGFLPYLDFLYHRLPLHIEVYGTLFKLFGASFITGRVISLFFTVIMINLCAWNAYRLTGSLYATFLAYLAFINSIAFWGYFTNSTYALNALLFMLILTVILSRGLSLEIKLFLFIILNFMILANRYLVDYHSFFLMLIVPGFLVYYRNNVRAVASILGSIFLGFLYIFKYSIFLGDRNIFYDTITFIFDSAISQDYFVQTGVIPPSALPSLFGKIKLFLHLRSLEIEAFYSIWVLCLVAIIVIMWMAFRKNHYLFISQLNAIGLGFCSLMVTLNFAFYYLTVNDWPVDKTYVFPFMVILAIWMVTYICNHLNQVEVRKWLRIVFILLFIMTGLPGILSAERNFSVFYKNSDVYALQEISKRIKGYVKNRNGIIMTFNPVLANSGLINEPRLNMELFAFKPYLDTKEVEKYRLMNADILKNNIRGQKYEAIILSDRFFSTAKFGMTKVIAPLREEIMDVILNSYFEAETITSPRYDHFKIYLPRTIGQPLQKGDTRRS